MCFSFLLRDLLIGKVIANNEYHIIPNKGDGRVARPDVI